MKMKNIKYLIILILAITPLFAMPQSNYMNYINSEANSIQIEFERIENEKENIIFGLKEMVEKIKAQNGVVDPDLIIYEKFFIFNDVNKNEIITRSVSGYQEEEFCKKYIKKMSEYFNAIIQIENNKYKNILLLYLEKEKELELNLISKKISYQSYAKSSLDLENKWKFLRVSAKNKSIQIHKNLMNEIVSFASRNEFNQNQQISSALGNLFNSLQNKVESSVRNEMSRSNFYSELNSAKIINQDGQVIGSVYVGSGFNASGNIYDSRGNFTGKANFDGGFNSDGSVYDARGNYVGRLIK
jgi:hypothetical protein